MRLPLIGLLLITACAPPAQNLFQVDSTASPGAVATLALCGKETPLKRQGEMLQVAVPIKCEGSGEIRVRLKDGNQAVCPIGYVTHGLRQEFRYRLEDGRCIGNHRPPEGAPSQPAS